MDVFLLKRKSGFGFLICFTVLLLCNIDCIYAQTNNTYTLSLLKAERKAAANKKRQIIYNDDGNETFRLVDGVSVDNFLKPRFSGIENSEVSSFFYCTSHAWGAFTHATKIGTVLTVKEDKNKPTGLFTNNLTGEYIAKGLDPLKIVTEFGHNHKKEVFWSMRMNDTHDSELNTYGPVLFNANLLKKAHPEYLVGTPKDKNFAGWSAVDYSLPEVRDYTYQFIAEVCNNYDVDGIELDFFRHRVYFKSTFKNKKASEEEIAEMSELIKRIRQMTEDVGLRRGRPVLISIRVPDDKTYCKALGLDIEDWLKDGLFDMMVVGGYTQLNLWNESVKLGHKYQVPVYPSLDDSRVNDKEGAKLRNSIFSYRGRAMNSWNDGADGIYIFNFFNPKSPIWNEIGDPKKLSLLTKYYFASVLGVGRREAVSHIPYIKIPTLNPGAPLTVPSDSAQHVNIQIGDNPEKISLTTLKLKFSDIVRPEKLMIYINGNALTATEYDQSWLTFKVKTSLLKNGNNIVEVANKSGDKLTWTDMYLIVKPNL